MNTITGFVYYLQNPINGEIFYVGATQCSLTNRLRTHYQHLREFERGLRKSNRRYIYLQNLRPQKATIHLLEIVTDKDKLEEREIFHIKHFRKVNPNLTNMTDGGKGHCTSRYYTERELEEYSKRLSKVLKGRSKPAGFAKQLSIARQGLGNPASRELKDWIVCFKEDTPIKLFKYGFEVNTFIGNKHAYGNVFACIKRLGKSAYKYNWKSFSQCSKEIQDIVHPLVKASD